MKPKLSDARLNSYVWNFLGQMGGLISYLERQKSGGIGGPKLDEKSKKMLKRKLERFLAAIQTDSESGQRTDRITVEESKTNDSSPEISQPSDGWMNE